MTWSIGRVIKRAAWIVLFAALPLAAMAQDTSGYPAKPVRFILPFPPGGPSDLMLRLVAQNLSDAWKQPVLVENRPGAGGVVGTEMIARAPGDGYTLGVGSIGTHAINVSLYEKLPYDALADFAPITLLASYPTVLVVHPSVAAQNVGELTRFLKDNPDKLAFGSAGPGSSAHLVAEMFKLATGTRITHVPYKGDAPALNDLVGGQIQLMFANLSANVMGFVQNGRLRALAVTSPEPSAFAPGVPTLAQSIPGFQARTWVGIFAPGRTPAPLVAKIHADIARVMALPAVRARFQEFGAAIGGNPPAEFSAFVKSEIDAWRPAVKASGARAD
jgi:tripartite-type tricarboxylate transporter receptor subunit TctC